MAAPQAATVQTIQPITTPSQGCSSGSGHYTQSVKATLQRAELPVIDRKLGRGPIKDPC